MKELNKVKNDFFEYIEDTFNTTKVVVNKWDFAHVHTPDFNFELSKEEIIAEAVKREYAIEDGENLEIVDPDLKILWRQRLEERNK